MIIVEGPDNSGKSTLISHLSNRFGLVKFKNVRSGPPVNAADLYARARYMINRCISTHSNNFILDRLNLISESIYGPLCRGRDLWLSIYKDKQDLLTALNSLHPFYIYCRPPENIIMNMKTHQEKDYDTPEHLQKVNGELKNIIQAYDNYFAPFERDYYYFHKYDYTKDGSLELLLTKLKEYLKYGEYK